MKILSLFCGCGGMDLGLIGGFSYLGKDYAPHNFEIVGAFDNDPYCTQIYNKNFRHKCEVMDVRSIEIQKLPDFDILIGGFPCQSFSISAQNPPRLGYKDERGMLFFEMVKILNEKKPRFFIAENVKGLLSANKGLAFPMIIKEFENAGYHVQFKLLNASEYGVPQKRERVIIVGFRDFLDYSFFQFPIPTTPIDKVALKNVINEKDNHNERLFFSEKAVAGMMAVRDKMNKGRAQSLDEPCNTISSHLAKVSLNSTDPVLLTNGRYRRFSSQECARIQSFPETFVWDVVSEAKQLKAIGNAVPPVLMWHIGQALSRTINRPVIANISQNHANKYYFSEGNCVQLTFFEPETLYISKLNQGYALIGSCRQGIISWIKESNRYAYPLTDDELASHPELLCVKKILIRHKKQIIGYFDVTSQDTVIKSELNAYGYPTRSSRHKANTKYLLFSLAKSKGFNISSSDFKPIIGKGAISDNI